MRLGRSSAVIGVIAALGLVAVALATAPNARAAFPGNDGRIVFESFDPRAQFNVEIYSVSNVGGDARNLTRSVFDEADPALSPNGAKIAFVRSGDIYTMNSDGNNVLAITSGGDADSGPAWSPNGTSIVFARSSGGNSNLFVWNGTSSTALTTEPGDEAQPVWSPNGQRIAYVKNNGDIFSIPAAGGTPTALAATAAVESGPNWAPDSSKIVYHRRASSTARWQIWEVSSTGTNPHLLISDPANSLRNPAYSPRGTRVVVERGNDCNVISVWNGSFDDITVCTGSGHDNDPDWGVPGPAPSPTTTSPGPSPTTPSPSPTTTPPPNDRPPVTTIQRPKDGLNYNQAALRDIEGVAGDPEHAGISKVEIALRRYLTNGNCENWNGSNFVAGACDFRNWQVADGTNNWFYVLPRVLTKSVGTNVDHYIVLARATDGPGTVETLFVNGRNRNEFEVI